jgi:hypothetical protein
MKTKLLTATLALSCFSSFAVRPDVAMQGDYLEVRSCDIYTGACIANSEMGLSGKEGMLVWSVRQGNWKGTKLDGLKVIAVVHTDDTLGDMQYQRHSSRAMLIVDGRASDSQRDALVDFAKAMAGTLTERVVAVKSMPMEVSLGECSSGSCAKVKAGNLVEVSTRCLGGKDHLCGNEENFYPPLTSVNHPISAYTELASFNSPELDLTWQLTDKRSAYLATFAVR